MSTLQLNFSNELQIHMPLIISADHSTFEDCASVTSPSKSTQHQEGPPLLVLPGIPPPDILQPANELILSTKFDVGFFKHRSKTHY